MPRTITLRREAACKTCGLILTTGTRASWDAATRAVRCTRCASGRVDGVAGASALEEHQRRRHAREARAKRRFGALGVAVTRIREPPQHETAWKRGAEGEQRVARALEEAFRGTDVVLLHDLRVPGTSANVDLVAVGPGGVTVIDAKLLSGQVQVRRSAGALRPATEQLLVAGRDRTVLVDGVERQIAVVAAALGQPTVDVQGVICLAQVEGLPLLRRLEVRGIAVDGPRRIARLAARPGALSPGMIGWVRARLIERLGRTS